MIPRPLSLTACLLLLVISDAARGGERIRISEVFYHPKENEALEFVELYNSSAAAVDLIGWSFVDGIRFGFDRSQILPAGGVVVVARDRDALIGAFDVDPAIVVGEFSGALDNSGELLILVDGEAGGREEFTYADDFPFDRAADGEGLSLYLRCLARPAAAPFNWTAGEPSPGRYEGGGDCALDPPPVDVDRYPIIINEIYYHPPREPDPPLEFIELYNRGSAAEDLSSWAFDRGVRFTFPAGSRLGPGEYLLVAQDPEALTGRFALEAERVLGPFEADSKLSNSGERIRLVDAAGELADEVSYEQDEDWPAHADGLGGSLQRVNPLGPSNASGNWRVAPLVEPEPVESEWVTLKAEGFHSGSRFYFYLLGAGEVLLDAVSLVERDGDGRDYLTGGEFSDGWTEWSAIGNHDTSEVLSEGGFGDGGPCLLIRATNKGTGFQHAVRQSLAARPDKQTPLVLTVHVKHLSGESLFVARSSVANGDNGFLHLEVDSRTGDRGGEATPLKRNLVGDGETPPTLRLLRRAEFWPNSAAAVEILARVEAGDTAEVAVQYQIGEGALESTLLNDQGMDGDRRAGDGVWSGTLPPAPDGSLVWFSLQATTASGQSTLWPRWKNPTATVGYYVVDERPETPDPVKLFYIFTPGALADLSCNARTYRVGTLVDETGRAYRDVGVKFRGETACNYPKKPLRVKFQKGDIYQGQNRLNFNAGWNDKSMLREQFAFDFFRDAGVAYSETYMARVHTNRGRFHGAYFTVEDPREEYLKRNRRDADGGLYKARSAMLNAGTSGYEPRNDAAPGHLGAIREFATDLNRLGGEELIGFLNANLDVEGMFDYQAVQAIITDGDSVVKNWLLYYGRHELSGEGPNLVTALPWDLDLTYGQMLLTTDVRHYNIHPLFQTRTYPFHDQGYHGILNALLQRAPDDYYIKAFYGRIWRLLEEKFDPEVLLPKIDRYDEATGDLAREDLRRWRRSWGSRGNDPDHWRRDFRLYVERRHAFLAGFLREENRTTLRRTFRYVPAPRLTITEIHYNPPGDDELEFVEILNQEEREIDLGGWNVPALDYVFPVGSRAAPREVFLLARNPRVLAAAAGLDELKIFGPYPGRLSNGGEILRLRDSGEGGRSFPETIDVVVYDDRRWPRGADGDGKSLELVSTQLDNDVPESWRGGWSPGQVASRNQSPVARLSATPSRGSAPLSVLLDGSASSDPEEDRLRFVWELPGGRSDDRELLLLDIGEPGRHLVGVVVTDIHGDSDRAEVTIVVEAGTTPLFVRGDANADGGVNLSDGIFVLRYLFSGDELPEPECVKSADVDDSGTLVISDAVYLLNYLFGRGAAPLKPFGDCGVDETEDSLTCAAYAPCGA